MPNTKKTQLRTKDARGRRVTQVDPLAMHLLRQHDVIDADVLRAILSEKGLRVKRAEQAAIFLGLIAPLAVISFYTIEVITGDIKDATFAKTSSLFFLCSIPWIIWYNLKASRFGNVTAAMLKYLRCPHCGYDLRMLPTDPADGATVCPECGCAWRLVESRTPGDHETVGGLE